MSPPAVVAHRGNAAEYPENTLPALRSALALGVRYIEFDVHLSSDGIPVVLHDASLRRTAGIEGDALSLRWSELEKISVHEPQRFGERYRDVKISSLSQILPLLAEFPAAMAFVELKRASLRKFGTERVVKRVLEDLRPVAARCVVISFDLPAVELARGLSGIRIGWVLSDYEPRSERECRRVQPEFLFGDQECLPAAGTPLWEGAWQWACYEVPHAVRALELAAQGVALVETTQVRQLLDELKSPGDSGNGSH